MRKRRLKHRLADALEGERRALDAGRHATLDATRLRLALEAVPDAMVVCDRAGGVLLRNRNGPELGSLSTLVDSVVDEMVGACSDTVPTSRTLDLHGPPAKALVITAAPLRANGERVGTVAIVEDISERRQLEAVRRDFVANVSHELRTPVGALALLGEALAGQTDPEVIARLAQRVTAEAERAGQMIKDLLDLSRIEADGLDGRRPVNVDKAVSAAVERVRPLAEMREVDVIGPAGARGLQVLGDELQLVSAVSNLVDNAVKYSDPGSTVKLKVRQHPDGFVEVTVRDRGIGIPARDLERIFERFYRVDRARSRGTGGTGLGLSIVRHIANNHGGEVTVQSTEGSGSTFTLRLPLAGP